jgi:hypothetical protein
MRKINMILIGITVSGTMATALVGSGAGATFTDAIHATQTINAGTLDVTVTGPGTTSSDGKSLTLDSLGPTGSTFSTGAQKVTIFNGGTIKATEVELSASSTWTGDAKLKKEIGVTITEAGNQLYDGLLTDLEANPLQLSGNLAVGATRIIKVTFYAGHNSVPSLTNAAEGDTVTPDLAISFTG